MAEKLLQIQFKLTATGAEYRALAAQVAPAVAAVPGLRWKVWTLNEAKLEAGGVYLFADQKSLDAYMASEIIAALGKHPGIRDITLTISDILTEATTVTRGPTGAAGS